MTTLVRPNEGAGLVSFGMTHDEVCALFADEMPRQKQADTAFPSDYFARHGIIVHYDDDGVVEAVELGQAAAPMFLDRSIVGKPFDEIVKWLRVHDPRVEVDDAGVTSYRFGVGMYAPHASKSPAEPVEGLIVFRPGYYD